MLKVTYTSNVKAIKQAANSAVFDSVSKDMYQVFDISQRLVPLDRGPLQESGQLVITKDAVYIGYGRGRSRKYAVDQHENLMWRHLPGRQAKYLEQPFRAMTQTMLANAGIALKGALS